MNISSENFDKVITDNDLVYFNYNKFGTTIIKIPEISEYILQKKELSSLAEVAEKKNFRIVINSSYFDKESGNYSHAGFLYNKNRTISNIKNDKQLTHIFSYNINSHLMDIYPVDSLNTSKISDCIAFQSGPAIIINNMIQKNFINNSLNGKSKELRTLIAYNSENEIYLIITREHVKLEELAEFLLITQPFTNKNISIMNLDGGSSTALFSKNNPELNFRENKRLPLLLGVK